MSLSCMLRLPLVWTCSARSAELESYCTDFLNYNHIALSRVRIVMHAASSWNYITSNFELDSFCTALSRELELYEQESSKC